MLVIFFCTVHSENWRLILAIVSCVCVCVTLSEKDSVVSLFVFPVRFAVIPYSVL